MEDLFSPDTKVNLDERGKSPEKVAIDGRYKLQVIGAHDTWKVNPDDKKNGKGRRIGLRLKVIAPIRMGGDIPETDEEFESRKSQVGRVTNVGVWINGDGNVRVLQGHLKLLNNIAGGKDRPSEALLKKVYAGQENGVAQYNLGKFFELVNINCTALLGRVFIGEIENATDKYPKLQPWNHAGISEDEQPEWDGEYSETLYSGTDEASKDFAKFLSELNERRGKEALARAESAGDGAAGDAFDGSFDDDDDLPF